MKNISERKSRFLLRESNQVMWMPANIKLYLSVDRVELRESSGPYRCRVIFFDPRDDIPGYSNRQFLTLSLADLDSLGRQLNDDVCENLHSNFINELKPDDLLSEGIPELITALVDRLNAIQTDYHKDA